MHLRHKIPWDDLVFCLRTDPTEILLPVGECGQIHLINKETEIKVINRKFIKQEQICTVNDCPIAAQLGSFSKNKLSEPTLTARETEPHNKEFVRRLRYFAQKFIEAVLEFVDTELLKHTDEVIENFKPLEAPKALVTRCFDCYSEPCRYNCENFLIFSMFTNNQIDHLLWLDKKKEVNIGIALGANYGGQAVGNGWTFLIIYHLLPFYLTANAIIACGYESDESKWGILAPESYFRSSILHDCDFITFVPSLRSLLHKDIFMKDMTKTMELLKECFRHIYMYFMLRKKLSPGFRENIERGLRNDFNSSIRMTFKFRNYDILEYEYE